MEALLKVIDPSQLTPDLDGGAMHYDHATWIELRCVSQVNILGPPTFLPISPTPYSNALTDFREPPKPCDGAAREVHAPRTSFTFFVPACCPHFTTVLLARFQR